MGLFKKGGGILKNPVEVLKEFDPHPADPLRPPPEKRGSLRKRSLILLNWQPLHKYFRNNSAVHFLCARNREHMPGKSVCIISVVPTRISARLPCQIHRNYANNDPIISSVIFVRNCEINLTKECVQSKTLMVFGSMLSLM